MAHAPRAQTRDDTGFFLIMAIVMALTIAVGFSFHYAMGRSSFAAPALIHLHAVVFMGWVVIYLAQNILIASGAVDLHRRLGWLATGWIGLMLIVGPAVTIMDVRRIGEPFFFRPQHFLIFDTVELLGFAALIAAGIAQRRNTGWHRRLNYCAMALLLEPAFGRLLPSPLLLPYAFEATAAVVLLYPAIGIVADLLRVGRVHPAWLWGIGGMLLTTAATEAITYSPVGDAIYRIVTAGSPGAAIDPLGFRAPPTA
jgi:hypothetical protein